jgi:hypothetical protein
LCCKLQWAPADNVKESGNAYATYDLQVAANRTGAHPLCEPKQPLCSSVPAWSKNSNDLGQSKIGSRHEEQEVVATASVRNGIGEPEASAAGWIFGGGEPYSEGEAAFLIAVE